MRLDFEKDALKGDIIFTHRLAYVCARSKHSWFQYRYPVRIGIKLELPGIELEETLEIEADQEISDEEPTSEGEGDSN